MNKENSLKILFLFFIICGVLSIFVGSTFSMFTVNLKGDKVNTVSSSKVTVTYTEPNEILETLIATDDYAINNSDYFEFTVSADTTGAANILYYIYLEEQEGNTIPRENVKLLLMDANNIPLLEYRNIDNGSGNYCYDYTFDTYYERGTTEFNNNCLNHLNNGETTYLMDINYLNNKDNKICKQYQNVDGETISSTVDVSNCRYGQLYSAKPKKLTDLDNSVKDNTIYYGNYNFTEAKNEFKAYRLKVWANGIENVLDNEVETEENTHEISSDSLVFNFKINVYAKQVELGL